MVPCEITQSLSGKHALHQFAMYVSQAELSTLIAIGQALVIDAAQMHYSGLQVVNVDAILDHVVGEFIGLAVDMAAFRTTTG